MPAGGECKCQCIHVRAHTHAHRYTCLGREIRKETFTMFKLKINYTIPDNMNCKSGILHLYSPTCQGLLTKQANQFITSLINKNATISWLCSCFIKYVTLVAM